MRKRKGTIAEKMLAELERCYPGGVTTRELALRLYGEDTYENRAKVSRIARTIRKWGYRAYGFGGVYSLCNQDPAKLVQVFIRSLKGTHGWAMSAGDVTSGIKDAGDTVTARKARLELKKTLYRLAESL